MYTDEEKAFYVGMMWSEGLTPNAAARLWGAPSRTSLGAWERETLAGRIDLVAKNDGAYVFIEVTAVDRSKDGFAEGRLTREQLEVLAATWFADNAPDAEAPVRVDTID